jgi:hypothetical protein
MALKVVASLGRVCGGLRLPRGRLSFRGRQPLARYLRWIISGRGVSSLWIGAACVREMGKLWITFFFTVMWLPLCGLTFLLGSVCLGLCLKELSIYLLVGGSLEDQEVLRFGRWCLSAFSGVLGNK